MVFTVFAIAYLNAPMDTGVQVHMSLDKSTSDMMSELNSGYKIHADNWLDRVRLDRALYGCVESAALWYKNLSETLASIGYAKYEYETCVFNKCH